MAVFHVFADYVTSLLSSSSDATKHHTALSTSKYIQRSQLKNIFGTNILIEFIHDMISRQNLNISLIVAGDCQNVLKNIPLIAKNMAALRHWLPRRELHVNWHSLRPGSRETENRLTNTVSDFRPHGTRETAHILSGHHRPKVPFFRGP